MTRQRRTDAEIQESVSLAIRLLDTGIAPTVIASQLMRRFGICRSSAFRDVAHANAERAENDGIKAPPIGADMLRVGQQMLFDMFVDAAIDGDRKEATRIHRELRESVKATGSSHYQDIANSEQQAEIESHKTE